MNAHEMMRRSEIAGLRFLMYDAQKNARRGIRHALNGAFGLLPSTHLDYARRSVREKRRLRARLRLLEKGGAS